MLMIRWKEELGGEYFREWYIGETLPKIEARFVIFEADDDELKFLLAAIAEAPPKTP